MRAGARIAALQVHHRQEVGEGFAIGGLGLDHAGGGSGDVEIFLLRCFH